MPTEIEKLVDTLLKKVYAKDKGKLARHSKKVKKIRKKKKSKKQALHSHFTYADKLLEYNQRRVGARVTNPYNKRRRGALRRMNNRQVYNIYNNTRMMGDHLNDWSNTYKVMEHLDWIDKQREEYNRYNAQHQAYQHYQQNVGQ